MTLFKSCVTVMVMICWISAGHAAGSTVNEDFSLVDSLCADLETMAKNKDQAGFLKLIDAALKLSEAQRRDNSLAIDRFRPKLRAAKKSVKEQEYDKAVTLLQEARKLMRPAEAKWDGGS